MWTERLPSLHGWLGLRFALVAALPLLVVGMLTWQILVPQLRTDISVRHESLARAIAGQISVYLQGAIRELQTLAQLVSGQSALSGRDITPLLDAYVGTGTLFEAVYILDVEGRVRYVGLPEDRRMRREDLLGLDFSRRRLLIDARSRPHGHWSDTFLSTVSARLAVALVMPVGNELLVGEVTLDRLSEYIAGIPSRSGLVILVLDQQGRIAASSRAMLGGQQYDMSALPIVREARQSRLVTGELRMQDEALIGTAVTVAPLDWTLLVAHPSREAFRPLTTTLLMVGTGMGIALALALVVGWLLARSLSGRFARYAEQARAIANGDYDRPWPRVRLRELSNLALHLQQMATAIQGRERELRQSEERFAKAFRSSPAAMLISTIDEGRIIDANERWMRLFGGQRESLVGRTTTELGVWRDREARQRMIAQLRASGPFQDAPVVFHTRDGKPRDVLWSTEIIRLGDQPVLLSLVNDLTEQRRTERALRQSEARLGAAIESIPFDFFIMDLDGRYLLQNSSSRARWGNLIGKRPPEAGAHQGLDGDWEVKQRRVRSGVIVDEELRLDLRGGERFFRNVLAPVKEGDDVCGLLELSIDITARKCAEHELRQHREHLEELVAERTAELKRAMSQLVQAEKLAALGNLVAGVAHELNTPLGNARMVASVLSDDLRELNAVLTAGSLGRGQLTAFLERGKDAADLLERNTARAADLIRHFKEVAVDQTSVRRRSFNLLQTMEEMLSTLHPILKQSAHQVTMEIPPDLALDSYPGPLEQVVTNLIVNSLTHAFDGVASGRIRIQVSELDSETVQLSYSDDGVGIPEAVRPKLFDPFFTTRLGQGGSGLGLYIVYNLVTGLLGGSIEVASDSMECCGAAFIVLLPRRAPQREAQAPDHLAEG